MTILRDLKQRVQKLERRGTSGWGAMHVAGLLCIVGAITCAALGKDGWGWLLLVAVLIYC